MNYLSPCNRGVLKNVAIVLFQSFKESFKYIEKYISLYLDIFLKQDFLVNKHMKQMC